MIESVKINRNFEPTKNYSYKKNSLMDELNFVDKKVSDDNKLCHPLPRLIHHPILSKVEEINFKPGINLIYARNGSGKSTILEILATLFHARQNYSSHITNTSKNKQIDNLFRFSFDMDNRLYMDILKLFDVKHDGKSVHYFDPEHRIGFAYDGHDFDHDFSFKDGAATCNLSSGQQVLKRLEQFFTNDKKDVVFKLSKTAIADSYNGQYILPFIEEFFKPKIEEGPLTYILDEPTRSLDTLHESIFWSKIDSMRDKQIIIATHSPFGFFLKDVNYIELESGYINECKKYFNF